VSAKVSTGVIVVQIKIFDLYNDDVITRWAFPESAGNSKTDKGIFLTRLASLASRNVISTASQLYCT